MRWKAIWCLLWHRHTKFDGKRPSACCRKCGMYFRWPLGDPRQYAEKTPWTRPGVRELAAPPPDTFEPEREG